MSPYLASLVLGCVVVMAAHAEPPTPMASPTVAGKIKCPQYYVCGHDGKATVDPNSPLGKLLATSVPTPVTPPVPVPTPTPVPAPAPTPVPPPVPIPIPIPPADAVIHNVSNAPAWKPSTAYSNVGHLGDRALVGSGPIYLLELIQAGTSGAIAPTLLGCPASWIVDGAATWQCLTAVDYTDLASALYDDPLQWQPHTGAGCSGVINQPGCYFENQIVIANGSAWIMCAGPSGGDFQICPGSVWPLVATGYQCTSAASGNGPAVPAGPNLDGTCAWKQLSPVGYSSDHSKAWSHILGASEPFSHGDWVQSTNKVPQIFNLWWSTTPYPPIAIEGHQQWGGFTGADSGVLCPTGVHMGEITRKMPQTDCPAVIIQAASGDGVCDLSQKPSAYNPAIAVAVESIDPRDSGITINCLQTKGIGSFAYQWHENFLTISNSLIDGSGPSSIAIDAGNVVTGNLIINRFPGAGATGLESKYDDEVRNNEFRYLGGGANSIAAVMDCLYYVTAPTIQNNKMVGFAYGFAGNPCAGAPSYTDSNTGGNTSDQPLPATFPGVTTAYSGDHVQTWPLK